MDKNAVQDLQSEDRLKLKAIYNEYRTEFLNFGKRYNLNEDDLSDVYQEAFLALRKLAIKGTLDDVKSSMKTYLFGICKFKIYDVLKRKKVKIPYEAKLHVVEEEIQEIEIDREPPLTEKQSLLRNYFKELGEKCQQVLTMYYYRGLNIKEIVEEGGYGNENVVKAQKSRCLKTLRELCNG
ncbi:sigma-70 family RNA polymerase sigma factor [Tamlana sp. 2_MG-2023]|uniref:RNA polymerase sigma factor n=1 Tax=unclassified Tamlana TaxID=2614803 RepID=UPI0026E35A94|nr:MULTISPECIES: sigma-70 family RNA polymerase sigma factor [unclassified Tamlana]MDO6761472.1 sigma-70 family RNA polymerase sigma factor [Tamlana sp. 2_MG-2023]MDO6792353.1 sigma-70 family RNA polymerase sigma factor [Tamlana sp. 1_MG-2023]